MRPILRNAFWWLTILLVLTLAMSVASCSCGAKNKQPAPGPGFQGDAAAKLMPANMDEATKQKCAPLCQNLCVRGKECKSPGFAKPARCAKVCLAMCGRGIVDEQLGECMTNAGDCTQVNACVAGLATKIKAMRAGGAKPGAAPTGAVAPVTPPAAPAAAPEAPAADGGK